MVRLLYPFPYFVQYFLQNEIPIFYQDLTKGMEIWYSTVYTLKIHSMPLSESPTDNVLTLAGLELWFQRWAFTPSDVIENRSIRSCILGNLSILSPSTVEQIKLAVIRYAQVRNPSSLLASYVPTSIDILVGSPIMDGNKQKRSPQGNILTNGSDSCFTIMSTEKQFLGCFPYMRNSSLQLWLTKETATIHAHTHRALKTVMA